MALEDYYETQSVSAGRSNYSCECCGGSIPKGTPSDVHKFYPEFHGVRTHQKCSKKFLVGHYCCECGEWCENGTQTMHDGKPYCEYCEKEYTPEPEAPVADKKLSENFFNALKRPDNFHSLALSEQWDIDKKLGILDWDPTDYEIEQYNSKKGR